MRIIRVRLASLWGNFSFLAHPSVTQKKPSTCHPVRTIAPSFSIVVQRAVHCCKNSRLAPNQIFFATENFRGGQKLFLNVVTRCSACFSSPSFGPNFGAGVVDALHISGCCAGDWGEHRDKRPARRASHSPPRYIHSIVDNDRGRGGFAGEGRPEGKSRQ